MLDDRQGVAGGHEDKKIDLSLPVYRHFARGTSSGNNLSGGLVDLRS